MTNTEFLDIIRKNIDKNGYHVTLVNGGANNLTIYNASSSEKTLGILLTIAAIGVPLVVGYTTFVFLTFKGKVKLDEMSY